MSRKRKRRWLVLTIHEPFPVNFGHTTWPSESQRDTAIGPFFNAPSRRYHVPDQRAYVEGSAAQLRDRGWTVTITEELR